MNEEYKSERIKQIDAEIQRLLEEKAKLLGGKKKTEWDVVKEEAERKKYLHDILTMLVDFRRWGTEKELCRLITAPYLSRVRRRQDK